MDGQSSACHPLQAHLVLESHFPFRLILYWIRLPFDKDLWARASWVPVSVTSVPPCLELTAAWRRVNVQTDPKTLAGRCGTGHRRVRRDAGSHSGPGCRDSAFDRVERQQCILQCRQCDPVNGAILAVQGHFLRFFERRVGMTRFTPGVAFAVYYWFPVVAAAAELGVRMSH